MKSRNLILLILFASLITPVLAVAPTSNFYLVPTDMKVYSMVPYDAMVYQDGTYTIAVNRTGGIINVTLISAHTDDVPIQAAINSVTSGLIEGGYGTYYINGGANGLSIAGKNNLRINFNRATFKKTGAVSAPQAILSCSGALNTNLTISGIVFDQDRGSYSEGAPGTQWILSTNAVNMVIEDCDFLNAISDGVVTGTTVNNIEIIRCKFDTSGEHPIYLSGSNNVKVYDSTFKNWGKSISGDAVKITNTNNVVISNCNFEQNQDGTGHVGGTAIHHIMVAGTSTNVDILNCNFIGDGTQEYSLWMGGTANNVRYYGCTFYHTGEISHETAWNDKTAKLELIDCTFDFGSTITPILNLPTRVRGDTFIDSPAMFITSNNTQISDTTFYRINRTQDYYILQVNGNNPTYIDHTNFYNFTYRGFYFINSTKVFLDDNYFSGGLTSSWFIFNKADLNVSVTNSIFDSDFTYGHELINGGYPYSLVWNNNRVDPGYNPGTLVNNTGPGV